MVSVQAMEIEAARPRKESGPYFLKTSKSNPVAAEEENILTRERGTNLAGKWMYFVNGSIEAQRKSKNPEALKIPTAVISPINVGMILKTVENPFLAPTINVSYTFILFKIP